MPQQMSSPTSGEPLTARGEIDFRRADLDEGVSRAREALSQGNACDYRPVACHSSPTGTNQRQ